MQKELYEKFDAMDKMVGWCDTQNALFATEKCVCHHASHPRGAGPTDVFDCVPLLSFRSLSAMAKTLPVCRGC